MAFIYKCHHIALTRHPIINMPVSLHSFASCTQLSNGEFNLPSEMGQYFINIRNINTHPSAPHNAQCKTVGNPANYIGVAIFQMRL